MGQNRPCEMSMVMFLLLEWKVGVKDVVPGPPRLPSPLHSPQQIPLPHGPVNFSGNRGASPYFRISP